MFKSKGNKWTVAIAVIIISLLLAAAVLPWTKHNAYALTSSAETEDAGREYYKSDYNYLDDADSVFQSITWEQAVYLFQQKGNYLILLGGSWCGNTTAVIDYINDAAKAAGVTTVYNLDFRLDGTNASSHIRETNGSTQVGANYNYLYGELVTRYLTNLNDWVEYKVDTKSALKYTNAQGEEVTVAKAQVPFLFLYNKDNTVNNAGESEQGKAYPIVYGFEKMLTRDKTTGELKNGQTVVTDYTQQLNDAIFSHIGSGEGKITLSSFTDADYIRLSYNEKANTTLFSPTDKINIATLTYKQLNWLLNQQGNYLILLGGSWCGNTQAVIKIINDYAVKNNVTVYNFDTKLDGGYAAKYWGYKKDLHIRDNNNEFVNLYIGLVSDYLKNIQTQYDPTDGNAGHNITKDGVTVNKLQVPYLFAYNKDTIDNNGHDTPILGYVEKMYSLSPARADFIYGAENYADYTSATFAVIKAYAQKTGATAVDIAENNGNQQGGGTNGGESGTGGKDGGDKNYVGQIIAAVVGVAVVAGVLVAVFLTQNKKSETGQAKAKANGVCAADIPASPEIAVTNATEAQSQPEEKSENTSEDTNSDDGEGGCCGCC